MFFIILAHSGYVPALIDRFYNSFFLSGFFMLSGYLFHNPEKPFSLTIKLKKIIDTLVIPYLLYWIISFSIDSMLKGDFLFMKELLIHILKGDKLWFMSVLIVSEIFLAIVLSSKYVHLSLLLFSVASLILWHFFKDYDLIWFLQVSFIANVFLVMGYFFRLYNRLFLDIVHRNVYFGPIALLWLICFGIHNYYGFKITFNGNSFGNIFYFIVYALTGSLLVYKVSYKISDITVARIFFVFIGINSLLFYFFQNQILRILKKIFFSFTMEKNYFLPFLIAFLVIAILYYPIKLVNRYFPILTGKSKLFTKW
ncbi:acyltransferase family protein [Sphingobacterium oryzagri]|uniref:acyltransferase family protein n=1 Tax=Sphingobacterium oryzagri TaxID=3025669 RepID=UPI003D16ABA6